MEIIFSKWHGAERGSKVRNHSKRLPVKESDLNSRGIDLSWPLLDSPNSPGVEVSRNFDGFNAPREILSQRARRSIEPCSWCIDKGSFRSLLSTRSPLRFLCYSLRASGRRGWFIRNTTRADLFNRDLDVTVYFYDDNNRALFN